MSGKMICPTCQGNGFIKKQVDEGRKMEVDCDYCESQGEVTISTESLEELQKSSRLQ